jgi:hypothetical protein
VRTIPNTHIHRGQNVKAGEAGGTRSYHAALEELKTATLRTTQTESVASPKCWAHSLGCFGEGGGHYTNKSVVKLCRFLLSPYSLVVTCNCMQKCISRLSAEVMVTEVYVMF